MQKNKKWGIVTSNAEARFLDQAYKDTRYRATIYTKPHCSKCKQTAIRLQIPKETRTLADFPDLREKFIDMGLKSMPVVVIYKGKEVKDIWCDYQIDKIREWSGA